MKLLPIGNGVLWHKKMRPAWRLAFPNDELCDAVVSLLDPLDQAGQAVDVEVQAQIDRRISEAGLPLIIACPPQFHLHYLKLAARLGLPAVLEKPLVHDRASLACFDDSALTERVFCLGYYALEKGLSLKHVLQPHPEHVALLLARDLAGHPADVSETAEAMRQALSAAPITRITLRMLEDDGRSVALDHPGLHWTEEWDSGANWLDMGVHMASLLALILPDRLPLPDGFSIRTATYAPRLERLSSQDREQTAPHVFQLLGPGDDGPEIDIAFGKYCVRRKVDAHRYVSIELSDGATLHCDFDAQATVWRDTQGEVQATLALADRINGVPQERYLAQLALARPMLQAGHWVGVRTDSAIEQRKGLDLLMRLQSQAASIRPMDLGACRQSF